VVGQHVVREIAIEQGVSAEARMMQDEDRAQTQAGEQSCHKPTFRACA
jgi:hypothetical protein